jgi:hypothetical protein
LRDRTFAKLRRLAENERLAPDMPTSVTPNSLDGAFSLLKENIQWSSTDGNYRLPIPLPWNQISMSRSLIEQAIEWPARATLTGVKGVRSFVQLKSRRNSFFYVFTAA